jgi:hypothetical protein
MAHLQRYSVFKSKLKYQQPGIKIPAVARRRWIVGWYKSRKPVNIII